MLVVFWILLGLALVGPMRVPVYLFFIAQAFGTFNTITGSMTLTPAAVLSPVLVLRILLRALAQRQAVELSDCLLSWRRLGLLSGFMAVTLMVTLTSPLLFADAPVIALNTALETGLSYTGSTLAQTIYLLASYMTAVSIYMLMLDPVGRRLLAQGILIGGATLVIAGVLDMLPGSASFLAPLRTSTYVMLAGAPIGDLGRVVGLSTEASTYGYATLAFATFCIFLKPGSWLGGGWAVFSPILAVLLVLFTVLSTSSAAYLGLAAMVGLLGLGLGWQLLSVGRRRDGGRIALQIGAVVLAVLAAGAALVMLPDALDYVTHAINTILFDKASSSSYLERSSWNRVSLSGFYATYGYGLGAGATRASSWPVALLAGSGIMGAVLMIGHIMRCLFSPVPPEAGRFVEVGHGARLAWIVLAIPAAGVATSIDFGFANAVLYAVMVAVPTIGGAQVRSPRGQAAGARHRPPLPDRERFA